MKVRLLLAAALIFCLEQGASAQVLVPPQSAAGGGGLDIAAVLSLSEIEYDFDNGGDGDVERTILGAAAAYGLDDRFDLYGELGYILEAELEGADDDDDGFLLGAGVRWKMYDEDRLSVHGLGGLRLIFEDYGDGAEGEIIELPLGVYARYALRPNFGLYGGLDLIPFSDGELDLQPGPDSDFDRDNPIGLRLGADFTFVPVTMNLELSLISEEAFTVRAIFPL